MQVLRVTYADPRTGPSPSLARAVQSRGALTGTVLQNQSGGSTLVETSMGRFSVQLSDAVKPGDLLRFSMVDGKLVAEPAPAASGPTISAQSLLGEMGLLSKASIQQRLGEMGVPQTESFATVARALLRTGIPLRSDVLQAIHNAAGPLDSSQEDALVLLLQRGVPISRESIQALASARAAAQTSVIDLLAGLRDEILSMLPAGVDRTRASEILGRIIGAGVSVGEFSQVTADHLRRYLDESGLNMDRVLGGVLGASGTMSAADAAALAAQNMKGDLLFLQSLLGLIRTENPTAQIASRLGDLLNHVEHALATIETSQISALPAAHRESPLPMVLFLPIFIDEQPNTLYLAVERDGGRGKGGRGEGTTMTMGLELTELGPVRIILGAKGKDLEVRFELQDEETREFVAGHRDEIAERLDAAGYDVLGVLAAVGRNLGLPESIAGAALGGAVSGPIEGLDVRA